MDDWVILPEGGFGVDRALLVGRNETAVLLQDGFVEVYTDRRGRRQVRGSATVRNARVVELLEDNETTDILLDIAGRYRFLLEDPLVSAGKVFSPGENSSMQFVPRQPWRRLGDADYQRRLDRLRLLGG